MSFTQYNNALCTVHPVLGSSGLLGVCIKNKQQQQQKEEYALKTNNNNNNKKHVFILMNLFDTCLLLKCSLLLVLQLTYSYE